MERQITKLHTDLQVTKKELSERTLQLSQLRKRAYCVFLYIYIYNHYIIY